MIAVLERDAWVPLAEAHRARARTWTRPHLHRRSRGKKHPVDDFLFEYYTLSPGALERWHPGLGVGLRGSEEHAALGAYTTVDDVSTVDPARLEQRLGGIAWARDLLVRTRGRAPRLSCFGLHEWAMVFRADAVRHELPLRLGPTGTDAVVDSHRLACTHVDAFRFFTDEARPLNEAVLGREHQLEAEQPGCLHASMDLYRIAFRLLPFVEAGVVLDAFALARDVREVDMRASPYDLAALDLEPVAIETVDGKAEYVRLQRGLTERAAPLRDRLVGLCDDLLTRAPRLIP